VASSWGKYVDPFGFRRLDITSSGRVRDFMGVNLEFRLKKSKGIKKLAIWSPRVGLCLVGRDLLHWLRCWGRVC
jgi:hypothetical protein